LSTVPLVAVGDAGSTGRTVRRPGTRAAETALRRRRLLEAATALAAEGGYDAVQMRDVAARAEVALGTLYRHYSSKDQLLLAALAEQADQLRERLQHRPPRGATPSDRVADALRRACRALEREPRVIAAMMTAMSAPDDDAVRLKRDVDTTLRAIITGAIDGAGGDAVDDVVRVLGSVWFAGLSFWVNGMSSAQQMADDLDCAAHLLLD
jgi:AcrR family transcriptional regulator